MDSFFIINQFGVPYPGTPLRLGSRGEDVALIQRYLNALSSVYPNIPRLPVDGVFGPMTQNAVTIFQRQFGLVPDGVVGPITWNTIVTQYNNLPTSPPIGPAYPGMPLRVGSRGDSVALMQQYLNALSNIFPSIPRLSADGVFGPITQSAVIAFQRQFGLTPDGIIGPITWNAIVTQYKNFFNPGTRTIVVDAGHGGYDSGAVFGNRLEKNDNLRLALAVQRHLQLLGQRVIMTRNTDTYLSLAERSAISNRNNTDIFISLHRDYSNQNYNGVQNFIYLTADEKTARYAQNVINEIVKVGVQSNHGVSRANFAVLRNTVAPAMLLEMGFINNIIDNQLFDQNFEAYAAAIARGLIM
jgi:N-acetylmuramoyl-L-alanine amidase